MSEDWKVFRGTGRAPAEPPLLPEAPRWRQFSGVINDDAPPPPQDEEMQRRLGLNPVAFEPDSEEVRMVNAAIHLRRALLITGRPGVGKSTLVHLVSRELALGAVLRWPITTRSTLEDGLYRYDAVGRLHASQLSRSPGAAEDDMAYSDIGRFITLGPLGTALLPANRPRAVLLDEIDKSDLDFPNDLLNVLEEGDFVIPELVRYEGRAAVCVRTADPGSFAIVRSGRVTCRQFPLVFMTSNGEKDFPPAFMRRCLPLEMAPPDEARLAEMVSSHIGTEVDSGDVKELIARYFTSDGTESRAADQLLNAIFIIARAAVSDADKEFLLDQLLKPLGAGTGFP